MTYVSRAERERALYVSAIDAADYICKIDGCSRTKAFRQLRIAAADGEVRIVYDRDLKPLPATREFWQDVWIQLSTGWVLDHLMRVDPEVTKAALRAGVIDYEPILVRREDLERVWPVAQRSLEPQPTGSTTQPELPVRRPASEADIRNAARELYQQPGTPPNQTKAEQLLMAKFPGTSRDAFIRPILQAEEFRALRLKPGNQRKT